MASLVQNGKNGLLVPSKQEQMFYEALVQLIENDALQTEFGIALYNKIQDAHSDEVVIKQYLNWLQNSHK